MPGWPCSLGVPPQARQPTHDPVATRRTRSHCIGLLSLSSLPAWAAAGTVTEFNVPSGTAFGITAGPDGNLWFTDNGASAIGRITPSGSITLFPVPGSTPEYITAGADGNLWFTDRASSKIGRITTGGNFTEFPVPTAGSALRSRQKIMVAK